MKKFFMMLILALAVSGSAVDTYAAPDQPQQSKTELSESDILNLCMKYVMLPPSDDPEQKEQRQYMAAAIVSYITNTDKFVLLIGAPVIKALQIGENRSDSPELFMVYMAAETIYCLEHNLSTTDAESYAFSMEMVLSQYSRMPKHDLKVLNKFMKMKEDERTKALVNYYNKEISEEKKLEDKKSKSKD